MYAIFYSSAVQQARDNMGITARLLNSGFIRIFLSFFGLLHQSTYLASRRGRLGGGGGKSPPRPEPRQTSLPLGVPRARSTDTL